MITYAYAESAPVAAAPQGSPLFNVVPILGMLVIFYFFLIRPQQKKANEHKKMIEALQKGDVVVTSGGVYATVLAVGDSTLEVKIAENVKIKILKSAVSEKVHSQGSPDGKLAVESKP